MTKPKLMISELTDTIYIVYGRNKINVTDKAIDFVKYVLARRDKSPNQTGQDL